jgi:hypothetical protein
VLEVIVLQEEVVVHQLEVIVHLREEVVLLLQEVALHILVKVQAEEGNKSKIKSKLHRQHTVLS